MNIKDIKELAAIMKDTGLTLLELEEEGTSIKLERNISYSIPMPLGEEGPQATFVTAHNSPAITGAPAAELRSENMEGRVIKSPTVGVYYSSPNPESPPYATVGSTVKTGDILCIIEAMKLMNEITADCDGQVAEVLAGNGQVVEYGQPLFRIIPA